MVLAGCAGTQVAAPEVAVEGGSLPEGVDADTTFERVQAVLGTDVEPPASIRVADRPTGGVAPDSPPFYRVMGVERSGVDVGDVGVVPGATTALGQVFVGADATDDPAVVEYVLAHEYVHFVQFRRDWPSNASAAVETDTTDGAFVLRSVVEGQAVVATDEYLRRHGEGNRTNAALYRRVRERLPPGSLGRYRNEQYRLGARYVADRFETVPATRAVFERPPTTSEQVIHGLAPGSEPPRPLSVRVDRGGPWRPVGTDRMGEAFLRVALADGVGVDRAERAAAGWGTDSLRLFRARGESAYAWTLRFDTDADAAEFRRSFRAYLNETASRRGELWTTADERFDLRPVGTESAVVLAGPKGFVRATAVNGTDGRVRLDPPATPVGGGERAGAVG
jgi:hypothetical protein